MKNETDTITVLLAVAWEVAEAVLALLIAAAALLITVARAIRRRAAHPAVAVMTPPPAAAPAPAVHPLALVAEQLEADLTSRQLQALTGTRRKASKASLAAVLVAC